MEKQNNTESIAKVLSFMDENVASQAFANLWKNRFSQDLIPLIEMEWLDPTCYGAGPSGQSVASLLVEEDLAKWVPLLSQKKNWNQWRQTEAFSCVERNADNFEKAAALISLCPSFHEMHKKTESARELESARGREPNSYDLWSFKNRREDAERAESRVSDSWQKLWENALKKKSRLCEWWDLIEPNLSAKSLKSIALKTSQEMVSNDNEDLFELFDSRLSKNLNDDDRENLLLSCIRYTPANKTAVFLVKNISSLSDKAKIRVFDNESILFSSREGEELLLIFIEKGLNPFSKETPFFFKAIDRVKENAALAMLEHYDASEADVKAWRSVSSSRKKFFGGNTERLLDATVSLGWADISKRLLSLGAPTGGLEKLVEQIKEDSPTKALAESLLLAKSTKRRRKTLSEASRRRI